MITGFRRSVLYVPGDSDRMLAKSADLDADALLLNLEDGVARSMKESARAGVCRALESRDFGEKEVIVRINSPDSDAGARDLEAVVLRRPDGICIPKVECADQVLEADRAIARLEAGNDVPPGGVLLHAMIESPAGVIRSAEIAAASPRMASLVFGSADYVTETRCRPGEDRSEMGYALQMIVNGARAAGVDAIDSPCFELGSTELLRREAAQARRLGFDGKSALHPAQLAAIHEAFRVSDEEIAWAREVLAELEAAEGRGRALSTLGGRLIDDPHRRAAERILRQARLRP